MMKVGLKLLIALVFCLVATPALAQNYPSLSTPPQLERSGQNDAVLIVGVGNYVFLPDVDGVVDTVNDWETYFTRGLGIPSAQIFTLLDQQATRERMEDFAVRAAESVGEGGNLWFVFVGHGAPTTDGTDGILVGVDAQTDPRSLQSRGLARNRLVQLLEAGAQSQTTVILDACFSGRTSDGEALATGMQPVVPDRLTADLEPAATTVILAAAEAQQFAGALPGTKRPAFSYILLGALRGWGADGGEVTADGAIHYVRQHLRHLDHPQTPTLEGASHLVLARGATESEPGLVDLMRAAGRPAEPPAQPESSTPTPAPAPQPAPARLTRLDNGFVVPHPPNSTVEAIDEDEMIIKFSDSHQLSIQADRKTENWESFRSHFYNALIEGGFVARSAEVWRGLGDQTGYWREFRYTQGDVSLDILTWNFLSDG